MAVLTVIVGIDKEIYGFCKKHTTAEKQSWNTEILATCCKG